MKFFIILYSTGVEEREGREFCGKEIDEDVNFGDNASPMSGALEAAHESTILSPGSLAASY